MFKIKDSEEIRKKYEEINKIKFKERDKNAKTMNLPIVSNVEKQYVYVDMLDNSECVIGKLDSEGKYYYVSPKMEHFFTAFFWLLHKDNFEYVKVNGLNVNGEDLKKVWPTNLEGKPHDFINFFINDDKIKECIKCAINLSDAKHGINKFRINENIPKDKNGCYYFKGEEDLTEFVEE
jgi:hypothetical protein